MKTVKACVRAAFGVTALGGCTTTRTLSVSGEDKAAPAKAPGRPRLQSAKRNLAALGLLTPTYKTRLSELLADVGLMLPPARPAIAPGRTFACGERLTRSDPSSGRQRRILVKADEETREFVRDIGT